jgi:hypothetical protein
VTPAGTANVCAAPLYVNDALAIVAKRPAFEKRSSVRFDMESDVQTIEEMMRRKSRNIVVLPRTMEPA